METEVTKANNDDHLHKDRGASSSSSHQDSSAKPPSPSSMAGYDPNRIPASVFSTKSGTEWSAASNESLFSIQMGNNSFSNDYAIMYGKSGDFDLNSNPQLKSGDLPRLDECSNNNRYVAPGKSSELSSLPPLMEQEEGSLQSGESSRVDKKDGSPQINQSPAAAFRTPVSPPANPRVSDVSGHSNKSFAFPVLTSDSGKKEQSIKVGAEKNEGRYEEAAEAETQARPPAQKPSKWFSCFSCSWPRCC